MREELLVQLANCTLGDIKKNLTKGADCTTRSYICSRALYLLISGKPNMFLQFVQADEIRRDKASKADTTIVELEPGVFRVQQGLQGDDSISVKLRKILREYEERPISEVLTADFAQDTPVIDAVAVAMLRHTGNPNVLAKVLSVFDMIEDELEYKIKRFNVENNKVQEV